MSNELTTLNNSLLRRSLLLHVVLTRIARHCRYLDWATYLVGSPIPILAMIDFQNGQDNSTINMVTLLCSCAVATLMGFRRHNKYDSTRATAKEQLLRYNKMAERIERELSRWEDEDENENNGVDRGLVRREFVRSIRHEFNITSGNDPHFGHAVRVQYEELCCKNGISVDSEMAIIISSLRQTSAASVSTEGQEQEQVAETGAETVAQRGGRPNMDVQWALERMRTAGASDLEAARRAYD